MSFKKVVEERVLNANNKQSTFIWFQFIKINKLVNIKNYFKINPSLSQLALLVKTNNLKLF